MTIEHIAVLALIAVLSVVQSFFGMGLLVFGTPTLLLAGYDFISALGILLPASFAISLLQVISGKPKQVAISTYLYVLCLPSIGIGLWLVDDSPLASWTNLLVGGTLLTTAVVRFWPKSQLALKTMLGRYSPVYHLFMGLIHGMTNLGGAMLAILASSIASEKEEIRYTVAHYYLAFSIIQMLVLVFVIDHAGGLMANIYNAALSALIYLSVGNRIFIRSSNNIYNLALTVFIAVYGVAVLIKY